MKIKFTKTGIFALIIALVLLTLAACSNNTTSPSSSETSPPQSETTPPLSSSSNSSSTLSPEASLSSSSKSEVSQQQSSVSSEASPSSSSKSEVSQQQSSVPVGVTHNASFADDGCLLFDNEHYGLRYITPGFTRDSEVASFTTQTAIEGIVWEVFTTKEYPNREYLLLGEWLCSLGCPQRIYTITIDSSSYDVSAESITVNITNTSEIEGGYGFLYRIDRNVNGTWKAIPLNINVNTIVAVLAPGKTNKETFRLFQDQYDYQPGTYRIVFLDGLRGLSCEFILE